QNVRRGPFGCSAGIQEESGWALLSVLAHEGTQVRKVTEPDSHCGLYLNWQQSILPLHHKVHLFTRGRSPVKDLRSWGQGASPSHELLKDEVLEESASRFSAGQTQRKSCVEPVKLRCLDETL